MGKNKKKKIVWILIIVILVGFVFSLFLPRKVEYLNPVLELEKTNRSLSNSDLRKINRNLKNKLQEKNIEEDQLVYVDQEYRFEGDRYIGRFRDSYPITYQFSIDTLTLEVEVLEISRKKIAEEELASDEGGFDPHQK